MMNFRTSARSAISTTVRTCTILCLRSSTLRIEWLNSSAISTVRIMPKIAWKTAWSAGSTSPKMTSRATRARRWSSATATTRLTRPVRISGDDLLESAIGAERVPARARLPQRSPQGGAVTIERASARRLGRRVVGLSPQLGHGSGGSGRDVCARVVLARPELEGEDEERDAEHERIGAEPPGQHHRPDERRDDEEHAPDH